MSLVYGSVCSGIEAASVAWHPLGWRPAFFAEIEPFPSAVLKHHYPTVPNFGDFTRIEPAHHDPIDLLVGGTPCQSFSIAGLRGGLADDRGNLALEFLKLAKRARPRWVVWENVPGVLSSGDGRDFGAILGGLVELGYGFAYRVLDAQYVRVDGYQRAVPQRRRRVFVVGYLGDWRRAAAVLFERASLLGNSAPSRQAGKRIANDTGASPRVGGEHDTGDEGGVARSLLSSDNDKHAEDLQTYLPEIAWCLQERDSKGVDSDTKMGHLIPEIAHALGAVHGATEDGTGRGTPIVPEVVAAPEAAGTIVGRSSRGGGQTNSPGHNADQSLVVARRLVPEIASPLLAQAGKSGGDRPPGTTVDSIGHLIPEVSDPITANEPKTWTHEGTNFRTRNLMAFSAKDHGADATENVSPTLRGMSEVEGNANGGGQVAIAIQERAVSENPEAGPQGKGHQADLAFTLEARNKVQAVAYDMRGREDGSQLEGPHETASLRASNGGASKSFAFVQNSRSEVRAVDDDGQITGALAAEAGAQQQHYVAFSAMPMNSAKDFVVRETDIAQPIMAAGQSLGNQGGDYVLNNWRVRRLTPMECERLQGFPDGYTDIMFRGKAAADGPRYKALGNSMAVNCMRWIGLRIQMVEELYARIEKEAAE